MTGRGRAGRVPLGVGGVVAGARALGAEQAAALAGGAVWPGTAAAADGDLGGALRAGRFTVAGACVFDPARPLDPAPAIRDPAARPGAGDLVAVQDVGGSPDGVTFGL